MKQLTLSDKFYLNIIKNRLKVYENKNHSENTRNSESVFSKTVKAGKRRTYFFDVKSTRGEDYFIAITESKKRHDGDGYDRHKIFIYKEDFIKFSEALNETVGYVKTELMPNFDFEAFNHANDEYNSNRQDNNSNTELNTTEKASDSNIVDNSDVDTWKI